MTRALRISLIIASLGIFSSLFVVVTQQRRDEAAVVPSRPAGSNRHELPISMPAVTSWTAYQDDDEGYLVEYPSNWTILRTEDPARVGTPEQWLDVSLSFLGPEQGEWHVLRDGIWIDVRFLRTNRRESLDQWLSRRDADLAESIEWYVLDSEAVWKQGRVGRRRVESCLGCEGPAISYYFSFGTALIMEIEMHVAHADKETQGAYLRLAEEVVDRLQLPNDGR